MKPNGKCFAENCEECNWWQDWNVDKLENGKPTGLKEIQKRCNFQVLFEFIPKIIGSIDGVQAAANEARNRSEEAKEITKNFGSACARAFNTITDNIKLLK